jgi:glycosyltransferase involved in cell wall biosynthesis
VGCLDRAHFDQCHRTACVCDLSRFIELSHRLVGFKHLSEVFLSIIIPVYNEERRLPATLEQVFSFLHSQPYRAEVIVVENGSQDNTLAIASEFARAHPELKVLQSNRKGKGIAVQQGMLAARGEYCFMCDADFSMPVSEINRFLPPALTGADIAIASREAPGAIRYNEPHYRHMVGRVFNSLIRLIALPGLHDTQCGFKCFRAEVARELFRQQTISGWSFDVEVLFIARRRGYRIVELPIPWYFNPESKISVVRDATRMAADLFAIRLNALRGMYNQVHAIQD